ncbi:MAG: RadC family protein [Clostridia bacterium]|nr:RadC family protein [Clostridia bacterium]
MEHEGHRDRLRRKIEEGGLKSLAEHEVLEYFLFAFVPRRNTNDIAHALLKTFGNLAAVCDARWEELERVEGMTHNAALFLSQLPSFASMYKADKAKRAAFHKPHEWTAYLCELIGREPTEQLVALCLDVKVNLLKTIWLETDQETTVAVSARRLVKEVLVSHAVNVVVGHNHPSQDPRPSREDLRFCSHLKQALATVDITLLDCVTVTQQEARSIMGVDAYDAPAPLPSEKEEAMDAGKDFEQAEEEELRWLLGL